MVAWGFAHAAWNVCYILGSLIFMLLLNWKLALLLLAVIPLVLLITFYFQKRILAVNRRIRAVNAQITGAYNEGITGAKTKTLVIEDKNIEEFKGLTKNMYRSPLSAMLSSIMLPLVCSAAPSPSVSPCTAEAPRHGPASGLRHCFAFYPTPSGHRTRRQTTGIFTETVSPQVGIERVTALLDEPKTISDTPEVVEKYGDVFNPKRENWEKIKGDITFENVWFRYPGSEEYILEDFSLHNPAGTTVALIGETGAGKSTLVNLFCRFYEPTKGRILIDGRDYGERSQLWLHSSRVMCCRTAPLGHRHGEHPVRPADATDEEVVAPQARLRRVVTARLPGYQTEVGEGETAVHRLTQLVSFARAIRRPPVVASHVGIDTETELLIQNAISTS